MRRFTYTRLGVLIIMALITLFQSALMVGLYSLRFMRTGPEWLWQDEPSLLLPMLCAAIVTTLFAFSRLRFSKRPFVALAYALCGGVAFAIVGYLIFGMIGFNMWGS